MTRLPAPTLALLRHAVRYQSGRLVGVAYGKAASMHDALLTRGLAVRNTAGDLTITDAGRALALSTVGER